MPPDPPASDRRFAGLRASRAVKGQAVRGAAASFAGQAVNFILSFGSMAVLARLLTPEDFGLIAMTAVITGFVGLFREAGLTQATVQQKEVTHGQLSTLFWINGALGVGVALVLAALSPAVAAFYDEPRLVGITLALSTAFALGGFSVQHKALLRREMRFNTLAIVEILATTSGIVLAVFMAWRGFGYWSLVGLSLGAAGGSLIASLVAYPWRPGLPRRGAGAGRMLRFGSDILVFNVINYFSRNADNLLIGWRWGATPLALYEKAYRILLLPVRQLNAPFMNVLLPTLARLREDPPRFARWYLHSIELLSGITIFLIVGFSVFAHELVWLWLGEQWGGAATLFRLLTIAAILGVLSNATGPLFISLGQTRKLKWLGGVNAALNVTAIAIGLPYGAEGVAIAYSAAMAIQFLPSWWVSVKDTPVSLPAFLQAVAPPLAAAAVAAGAALLVKQGDLIPPLPQLTRLGLSLGCYAAVYAGILLLGFRRLRLYVDTFQALRSSKGSPAEPAASG